MNKKKSGVVIILVITFIISAITYAQDDNEVYNLDKLTETLISKSLEIEKMENNTQIMKLQYDKTLEDYEDLQESIENVEAQLEIHSIYKTNALERYETADEDDKSNAEARYNQRLQVYETTEEAYKNAVKQEINAIRSMEQLKLQIDQSDRKEENFKLIEKYNLQKDYYNLYILNEEIELLKKDIENLQSQKDIEVTKKNLDMTTRENIQSVSNNLIDMQLNLEKLKNQRELAKESLKTKIDMNVDEELNLSWKIPSVEISSDYKLAQLINNFKDNNLELEAVGKNVNIQEKILEKSKIAYEDVEGNEVEIALLELKNAKIDEKTTERDMELYVKQGYFDLKTKEFEVLSNKISENYYKNKENNLRLEYEEGVISKYQFNLEMQQLHRERFQSEKAIIAYLNAKDKLDLINKGIMN